MTRTDAQKILSTPLTILDVTYFRDREALIEIQVYQPAGYLPRMTRTRRVTLWGSGEWQHVPG